MTVLHREDLSRQRQVKLTIQVEKDVWQKALMDAYEGVKTMFPVDGEVTRQKLEAAYGSDFLYQEAVNAVYPQALVDAIAAEDIQLAGTPTLHVDAIDSDGFSFTALIDLYPEVTLGQYKGLAAPYGAVELSAEDTEQAIRDFLQDNLVEEHPDRAAMGDEVTIDFEGFLDGVAFPGGKGEQYPLLLGSGMFIPGFEEQVAGMAVGQERDVKVTFPTEYTAELAGKDAVFQVKCHAITRRSVPELDDALAQALDFTDASALRRHIMEDALARRAQQRDSQWADALVQQVIDNMTVALPPAMIENQLDGLLQELKNHMAAQGMALQDYLDASGLTMDDLRSHSRSQAENAARYELAMTEIARLENLDVTEEELAAQYDTLAAQYQIPRETLRAQLPPVRLRHDLRLAKARALVTENGRRL
ncbi:MAG: trigger factor [Oscillospiraceae bacterium]|nr:trigger factor [Oscillospiraceae bacterium]